MYFKFTIVFFELLDFSALKIATQCTNTDKTRNNLKSKMI